MRTKIAILVGILVSFNLYGKDDFHKRICQMDSLNSLCNEAYLINDFTTMREILAQWASLFPLNDSIPVNNEGLLKVSYANYYKQCGSYYFCIADDSLYAYGKAVENYTKSLEILKNGRNDASLNQLTTLNMEFAQIHYKFKNWDKALLHLADNLEIYDVNMMQDDWNETILYYALCLGRLGRFSEALDYVGSLEELKNHDYLRAKGKIASLAAESSPENATLWNEAYECYTKYFEIQKDMLNESFRGFTPIQREEYWLRQYPFMADCYRLEDEVPGKSTGLLYDVALLNKNLLLQHSPRNVLAGKDSITLSWKDVQKNLLPDECAIEFIQYEKCGQMQLGALLLRDKGVPSFIRMITSEELSSFVLADNITVGQAVVKDDDGYKNALYASEDLKKFIWSENFISKLKGVKKVYFSPDGIFHNLAIEYLVPDKLKLDIFRLTSTRELVQKVEKEDVARALVYGNIDFMKREDESVGDNDSLACYFLVKSNAYFGHLSNSAVEADSILRIRGNDKDVLKYGKDASEGYLREHMAEFNIVHLATHGNYDGTLYPESSDLKGAVADETLSKSVLVLSGAQDKIKERVFDATRYDGIISAREISSLDLSGVSLFVASACQSGLGKVTAGGVYGLQRGLKSAGAGAMILSLWSVSDEATCYFMVNFYKNLKEGYTIHQAFWAARDSMDNKIKYTRKKYNRYVKKYVDVEVKGAKYSYPCYKNAFILIDSKL